MKSLVLIVIQTIFESFSLTFTYPPDQVGGVLLKDGNWTGIMRGVFEKVSLSLKT